MIGCDVIICLRIPTVPSRLHLHERGSVIPLKKGMFSIVNTFQAEGLVHTWWLFAANKNRAIRVVFTAS